MPWHACLPALPLPGLKSFLVGLDSIYRVVLSFGAGRTWKTASSLLGGDQAGATDLSTQAPKNSWHHQFRTLGCIFGWPGVGLAVCPSFAWLPLSVPRLHRGGAEQELWCVNERAEISPVSQGWAALLGVTWLTSTHHSLPMAIAPAAPNPTGCWPSPHSFLASCCSSWLLSASRSSAAAAGPSGTGSGHIPALPGAGCATSCGG